MGVSDILAASTAEVNPHAQELFAKSQALPVPKTVAKLPAARPPKQAKKTIEKKKPRFEPDSEEKLARTLFIGNVPVSAKKNAIRSLAAKFGGPVDTLRFRSGPVNPKNFRSAKEEKAAASTASTMNAYVVFKASESVGKSLKSDFQGFSLEGHLLRLDRVGAKKTAEDEKPAHAAGTFDRKRSVYVWGLPSGVTDTEIVDAFQKVSDLAAKVKGVRIVKDFAYVMFADRPCVNTALERQSEIRISGKSLKFERVGKPEELKQRQEEKRKLQETREAKKQKSKERLTKRFGNIDNKNFPDFLKKKKPFQKK